jgi:hypothetical protein
VIADASVLDTLGHLVEVVGGPDTPPIIIGHFFGGTLGSAGQPTGPDQVPVPRQSQDLGGSVRAERHG